MNATNCQLFTSDDSKKRLIFDRYESGVFTKTHDKSRLVLNGATTSFAKRSIISQLLLGSNVVIGGLVAEVRFVQLGIVASGTHEAIVVALFNDVALVEHDDAVSVAYG